MAEWPFSFSSPRVSPEGPLREHLREIRENLAVVKHYAQINNTMMETLMALADDFKAEITAVGNSMDAAIALLQKMRAEGGVVTDAEVQQGVTELQAARAKLDAAVAGPQPEPAPAGTPTA